MKPDPLIDRSEAQKALRVEKLRAEIGEILRQSVPTAEAPRYWELGWVYIMPDFDKPNQSIVEWQSDKMPAYPVVGAAQTPQDSSRSDQPEGESNAVQHQ